MAAARPAKPPPTTATLTGGRTRGRARGRRPRACVAWGGAGGGRGGGAQGLGGGGGARAGAEGERPSRELVEGGAVPRRHPLRGSHGPPVLGGQQGGRAGVLRAGPLRLEREQRRDLWPARVRGG